MAAAVPADVDRTRRSNLRGAGSFRGTSFTLGTCPICQRTFGLESIQDHADVCAARQEKRDGKRAAPPAPERPSSSHANTAAAAPPPKAPPPPKVAHRGQGDHNLSTASAKPPKSVALPNAPKKRKKQKVAHGEDAGLPLAEAQQEQASLLKHGFRIESDTIDGIEFRSQSSLVPGIRKGRTYNPPKDKKPGRPRNTIHIPVQAKAPAAELEEKSPLKLASEQGPSNAAVAAEHRRRSQSVGPCAAAARPPAGAAQRPQHESIVAEAMPRKADRGDREALELLAAVRESFAGQKEKVDLFVDIMTGFQAGNLDTVEVMELTSKLFQRHWGLLERFNRFLPDGYHTQPLPRSLLSYRPCYEGVVPATNVAYKLGSSFVRRIVERLKDQPEKLNVVYNSLEGAQVDECPPAMHLSGPLVPSPGIAQLLHNIRPLLKGYPDILLEFYQFIPPSILSSGHILTL